MNYRRGYLAERRAAKVLERAGYVVARTAGSHSPFDVVAVNANGVRLIQVKRVKEGGIAAALEAAILGLPGLAVSVERGGSGCPEEAARLADWVVVLCRGRVCLQGTPREVFAHPAALLEAGLHLPFPSRLMHSLREEGLAASTAVLTLEEAEAELEGLRSRGRQH